MQYSKGEEIFNFVSHCVGAVFGVVALILLVTFSAINNGSAIDIVGLCIYGTSLIILYTMSSLYHAITNKNVKKVFRIIDHSSVYILISGSITPYLFSAVDSISKSWTIFGFIWSVTIIGIILYAIFKDKVKFFNIISYIILGWSVLIIFKDLINSFLIKDCMCNIYLLIAGGVTYTIGVIFYAIKKIKYFHSIWHLFVLAGSILHFIAMMIYIIK